MPGIELDCFPWNCPRNSRIKKARSRALTRSSAKAKPESPAIVIGSFKLLNSDKVRITISQRDFFYLPITAEAKHALERIGDRTDNHASRYGMALIKWKTGPDAKVTSISTFSDPKPLAKDLAKYRALAVFNKWAQ